MIQRKLVIQIINISNAHDAVKVTEVQLVISHETFFFRIALHLARLVSLSIERLLCWNDVSRHSCFQM